MTWLRVVLKGSADPQRILPWFQDELPGIHVIENLTRREDKHSVVPQSMSHFGGAKLFILEHH